MADIYHARVRSDVFEFIPRGGRLLDVGGGVGRTASAIRAAGIADHVGVVDIVPPDPAAQLDFAYQGDLEDPLLTDRIMAEQGPFDTILCLDVLEHFADPWSLIRRLHGLLAPGGAIVASIPNVRHYSVALPLLLKGQWRYGAAGILDQTHLRFFVRETAAELMTCSGLELDLLEPSHPPSKRIRWMDAATFGLLTGLTCMQYVIRVRNGAES
jgi:2-polyprenyl-3-methyl-5-hydroxy-6-metoxy-1,4-benzoquinol methylase